jgi:hypothetical protein
MDLVDVASAVCPWCGVPHQDARPWSGGGLVCPRTGRVYVPGSSGVDAADVACRFSALEARVADVERRLAEVEKSQASLKKQAGVFWGKFSQIEGKRQGRKRA